MVLDIYLLFWHLWGDKKVDDASQGRCLLKFDVPAAAAAAVVIQVCQGRRAGWCLFYGSPN